jgi:hypothetical protein
MPDAEGRRRAPHRNCVPHLLLTAIIQVHSPFPPDTKELGENIRWQKYLVQEIAQKRNVRP